MVSSSLSIPLPELVAMLARLGQEHAADPEYAELRSEFPDDWPM